jgi:hypothetical protein
VGLPVPVEALCMLRGIHPAVLKEMFTSVCPSV